LGYFLHDYSLLLFLFYLFVYFKWYAKMCILLGDESLLLNQSVPVQKMFMSVSRVWFNFIG